MMAIKSRVIRAWLWLMAWRGKREVSAAEYVEGLERLWKSE
jgi:hypothetical protein